MTQERGSTARVSVAERGFDLLRRRQAWVLICVALSVLGGLLAARALPVDMSFRPTFIGNAHEVERTRAHEQVFGQVGFRDLVAIVDLPDSREPRALSQVARLAERLARLPNVVEVRDPLHFPFFDAGGALHPGGVLGSLPEGTALDSPTGQALIASLLRSPSARRVVIGDEQRRVAVMASLDLPNEAFFARRETVNQFRDAVRDWSKHSGYSTQITGYPEVEQVYAHEVLCSVFRSVALLLAMMVVILFVYFRRVRDVVTCLAGVTLSVPVVLGLMALFGQPFSIVNSQVLTLVLIVGIGQALHHQEEYRRRRELGRSHTAGNREAFVILAWPSFMTGLATLSGFLALCAADMRAIWSFGLSTALGVAVVYALNWLVVPPLIQWFYRDVPDEHFGQAASSWTLSVVRAADAALQRYPGRLTLGFALLTALLAAVGVPNLSIDQHVNEELPADHPAVRAQLTYEREFAGFLGPELAIDAAPGEPAIRAPALAAFVNRLCEMPEVRYVASPLDFSPQPDPGDDKPCRRSARDLAASLAARSGAAGPELARLAHALVSNSPAHAAVVVRVADMGTAKSLPFMARVRAAARETLTQESVEPVGQWWLAQQGMNRLSFDVMWSAVSALLVILPIMWFAIRDFKLFLAAIPATILPVFATLGFMGLLHITVRIGTAMILAIALGLAADDTVHLSLRIRDRVRAGCDPRSAVSATLLRTGRPCSFSSYVLIGGFASMLASSLLALQAMGVIAMFSMTFALATDLVLGPALYLLLTRAQHVRPGCDARSLAELLSIAVEKHPERPAISDRERTLNWHDFARAALGVVDRLRARQHGLRVVAILADTDARYPIIELAVLLSGRALQPLYVTANDEELQRALAQTGAELLLASSEQLARAQRLHQSVLELSELLPLRRDDSEFQAEAEPFDTSSVRARLASLGPRGQGLPALYLQSTGTTGPARSIVVGEPALLSALQSAAAQGSHPFPRFLSFLPTAHISERLLTLYVSIALAGHTFYGGGLRTLADDLKACQPTALLTPPLLLESLRSEALGAASKTAVGRWFASCVKRTAEALLASGVVGGAPRGWPARLFGAQLRRRAGLQRVRDFLAGAAPVPAELQAWCEAVGLPLRIVYGQTELIGATTISPRTGAHFGAVGLPLPGVELRLSPEQELLVRSRAHFDVYLAEADATRATLEHGWLRSGDRARRLESGEIVLLGRMQAVLRCTDGSLVDTADIAAALSTDYGRAECVFVPATAGASLYVALPGAVGSLEPLTASDPRWAAFGRALCAADPAQLITHFALFEGAFEIRTGELGPTGKPRGYRIRELRSEHLRLTATTIYQENHRAKKSDCVEPRSDRALDRLLDR